MNYCLNFFMKKILSTVLLCANVFAVAQEIDESQLPVEAQSIIVPVVQEPQLPFDPQLPALEETQLPVAVDEGDEIIEPASSCDCNPGQPAMVLTLEYSINRALTANRQILTSVNALQNSQLRLELAYSDFDLKMRPIGKGGYSGGGRGGSGLDVGAGLTWEKRWATGTKMLISPYARRLEKTTQIDVDASLIQPVLKGFNREYNLSSLRGAQYSARSAVRSLHIAQTTMVTKTITTLYEYVKLKKTLEVQKEILQTLRKHCKIIKQKEARDLSESSDVFKIEADVLQAEETVRNTETKFKENQDAIRELLVLDIGQCFDVDVPLNNTNCEIDCEQAINIALTHRTEIAQSLDEYNEKNRLAKVAKVNLKPDLDVVLRYNNTGYDRYFRDIKERPESTWTINLTTTTDFARVSEKIAYDQSLIAIETAMTALDQTKEKIILEVKRAHRQLIRAAENLQHQTTKIASLKGELKFQRRKYEKGQMKIGDVMKTEQNICSAELAQFSTTIDQIIGDFALKASMGLLIEKPILNA